MALAQFLHFFQINQDALWSLLENSGRTIRFPKDAGLLRVVTYQLAVRMLSMSQVAMRIAISGYLAEALALSRTMTEMIRINTYLALKPDEIERYMSGELRVTTILKLEQELYEKSEFSHHDIWKHLSTFAHATADLLNTFTLQQGTKYSVGILISDPESIETVCHGIVHTLFMQYCWFRLIFRGYIEIPRSVRDADKLLLNSELPQSILGEGLVAQLPEMYKEFYNPTP